MRKVSTVMLYVFSLITAPLPATRLFAFKRIILTLSGVKVGKDVRIVSGTRVFISGTLEIGDGTWIGHDVLIAGGEAPVEIGEKCDIGPRVTIVTGSHEIQADSCRAAGRAYSLPIVIGSGCWIGAGAIILGGTKIGQGSVVAAGSVVKGVYSDGCLIAGVPAIEKRKLKK